MGRDQTQKRFQVGSVREVLAWQGQPSYVPDGGASRPPERLAINDPEALTLLLCDDHTLFREALAVLLEQRAGWRVIGQAGDGDEAVRLAVDLTPDVAVLDIAMPGVSGIDAAQRIRDARPGVHIVALSMYGDDYYRQRMLCAGAQAFVLKNEAGGELIQAIEAVLRGETYVSAALREGTAPQSQCSGQLAQVKLTPRECDVLRLLAEGQRTKEIAKAMAISPKTVETYRNRITLKVGVETLADLIKFAIRAGIVSVESR